MVPCEWSEVLTDNITLGQAARRGRLVAAGILPASAWTAGVFALQVALYGLWFGHRATAAVPQDDLLWSLLVLILVSPLFDAVVFTCLFLAAFPLLWQRGRLVIGAPGLIALSGATIAMGALALVGSGCHVVLTIAAVPAMIAAAAGTLRHQDTLRRVQ